MFEQGSRGKNPRKLGHIMCWQPFFTSPFLFKEQDALFLSWLCSINNHFSVFSLSASLVYLLSAIFWGHAWAVCLDLFAFSFFDHTLGFVICYHLDLWCYSFCSANLWLKRLHCSKTFFLENSKHWIVVLFFKNTKNPIFLCRRKMIAFKCENKGIFKRKGAVLQPIFLASNPWIASIGKGQQT